MRAPCFAPPPPPPPPPPRAAHSTAPEPLRAGDWRTAIAGYCKVYFRVRACVARRTSVSVAKRVLRSEVPVEALLYTEYSFIRSVLTSVFLFALFSLLYLLL